MENYNLYKKPYHEKDISKVSFLITGGAGFIGSNIVEYLLRFGAGHVRVLDNLSTGYYENIKEFIGLPNFEFVEGDIRNLETCKNALIGIDYIAHQAALGSVPRSISDPIASNDVNVNGFLNLLIAAKDSKSLKRMVYAASSSTYGDSLSLPKIEGTEGRPLSPYAVTKLVNELYAEVFSRVYGFSSIGLRYFNVFGPKQNPDNPYAAVIPVFCKNFIEDSIPLINGDGSTTRDFTFVENAVQANILALLKEFNSSKEGSVPNCNLHEIFNVACGEQISLKELVEELSELSGKKIEPIYNTFRVGDVHHSKASIAKIKSKLGYYPSFDFKQGLNLTFNWYLCNSEISNSERTTKH